MQKARKVNQNALRYTYFIETFFCISATFTVTLLWSVAIFQKSILLISFINPDIQQLEYQLASSSSPGPSFHWIPIFLCVMLKTCCVLSFIKFHIVHLMLVQLCWWHNISVDYDITRYLYSISVKRHHNQGNFYKRKYLTWHLITVSELSALSKWLGVWQHTDYQKRNVNSKPVTHPLIYKGDILPESYNRAMVAQWLWE